MLGDLLANLPTDTGEESFEDLLSRGGVRIERIVTRGQCSPEGFWYDQPHAEWVVVLQGAARLEVEVNTGDAVAYDLRPGSWVDLPAHRRHRVAWTSPDEATVWLAVHWDAAPTRI